MRGFAPFSRLQVSACGWYQLQLQYLWCSCWVSQSVINELEVARNKQKSPLFLQIVYSLGMRHDQELENILWNSGDNCKDWLFYDIKKQSSESRTKRLRPPQPYD